MKKRISLSKQFIRVAASPLIIFQNRPSAFGLHLLCVATCFHHHPPMVDIRIGTSAFTAEGWSGS